MTKVRYERIGIPEALKRFGGFVRYYDSTEPLAQLANIVSAYPSQDILACCGGGNQALTMLGAASDVRSLCAVDVNSAQLFVLAAKADFLKQKNIMPSFEQLRQKYPERITAVKRNIRRLKNLYLYNMDSGKMIPTPAALADRYAVVKDAEMFILSKSGPFWQEDKLFRANVRVRLGRLRLAQMDIFNSPDYFKQGSLDLIYISDIFWPEVLAYYQAKLARMSELLRPGGCIISHLDPGDDFLGLGISPGRLLAQKARELRLKINTDKDNGYLVLERIGRRQ